MARLVYLYENPEGGEEMIERIEITFPNEKHMDTQYRTEIYKMFKLLCENIDNNGLPCVAVYASTQRNMKE